MGRANWSLPWQLLSRQRNRCPSEPNMLAKGASDERPNPLTSLVCTLTQSCGGPSDKRLVLVHFREALLGLVACVVGVGVFFLPEEARRLEDTSVTHVIDYVPLEDGRECIALVQTMDAKRKEQSRHQRIVWSTPGSFRGERKIFPVPAVERFCVHAATHQLFAVDSYGTLIQVDLELPDATPRRLGRSLGFAAEEVQCSSDGRFVLMRDDQALTCWHVRPSDELLIRPIWCYADGEISAIAMDPKNPTSAILARGVDGEAELEFFDVRQGPSRGKRTALANSVQRIVVSPNACKIGCIAPTGEITFLQRASVSSNSWSVDQAGAFTGLACAACFSPDSTRLATSDRDGREVWLHCLDGTLRMEQVGQAPARILGVRYLDDHQLVAWGFYDQPYFVDLSELEANSTGCP